MVILLAILVLLSAYFSATETAFSALNRIKLKNLAALGNGRAQRALKVSENYDKLLSTILIGNNLVNIGAASLATVLFVRGFGENGVTISTLVMTALILIFGEISPKSLVKEAPEAFAMATAPIISVCMVVFTPLNYLFTLWKGLLSRVFNISADRGITEEELITMVEEAENEGGIDAQESQLIRSAIEFDDLDVTDVLTPRVDVIAISKADDQAKIREIFLESGYSRLPVYEENIDNVIGVIHQKDFYNYVVGTDRTIADIIKPAVYASYSMQISKLLKLLQQTKSHIAVVADEFGGTMGIVTLEDIIEELVGEIWDEHDEVVSEFEKVSDNAYRIACSLNLDKMFDLFNIRGEVDASTVSGWVVEELGHIPEVGDSFTYENLRITVTKTDARRVIEILVTVENPDAGEE